MSNVKVLVDAIKVINNGKPWEKDDKCTKRKHFYIVETTLIGPEYLSDPKKKHKKTGNVFIAKFDKERDLTGIDVETSDRIAIDKYEGDSITNIEVKIAYSELYCMETRIITQISLGLAKEIKDAIEKADLKKLAGVPIKAIPIISKMISTGKIDKITKSFTIGTGEAKYTGPGKYRIPLSNKKVIKRSIAYWNDVKPTKPLRDIVEVVPAGENGLMILSIE